MYLVAVCYFALVLDGLVACLEQTTNYYYKQGLKEKKESISLKITLWLKLTDGKLNKNKYIFGFLIEY